MPPRMQDLILPPLITAIVLILGAQALRVTSGGGEVGPKGKAYLIRGCLILLAVGYGEVTVPHYSELGFPLTILILCLLAWFVVWQVRTLVHRIKTINREEEALLAGGELKLVPLRPAQKVVNVVLIVWGSLGILGTIIAFVMKFG